jgi:alpha-1,2-mannosyltransferase
VLLSLAFPQSVTAYVGGAWRYAFEIGAQQTAQNHSLAGLVRNALLPSWIGALAVLAVFIAGVAAATVAWRRGDALAGVSISLLAGLLVSPLSWTHHWVAAFPVMVLLVRELRGWTAGILLGGGVLGMLLWLDVLGRVGQLQPASIGELVVMQWLPLWGLAVLVWCVRGVILAPPMPSPASSVALERGLSGPAPRAV